jgi:hypothetical protein
MESATDNHVVLNANLPMVQHVFLHHARRPLLQNA